MIPFLKSLLIIFCVVFMGSCSKYKNNFKYKAAVNTYSTIALSKVEAFPDEGYYMYVPTNYESNQFYPLMLCLSPKGNGLKPVEAMRFAAETFGYIVVGSNAVRNNYDGNGKAIRNLIYDVQKKYTIDQGRMYACGFSGGGRIATILGNKKVLSGVISCSAGPGDWSKTHPYPWYGIVGKADFNYTEFAKFHPGVLQKPFYNTVYHNGGHEWPDSSYLYDACAFLELHAIKSNTMNMDTVLLAEYEKHVVSQINDLKLSKNYNDAFNLANNTVTVLSGLAPSHRLSNLANQLYQSSEYKMDVAKQAELNNLQKKLTKVYTAALTQKDTRWWKNELESLDDRIITSKGETSFTFKRTKATLGILCYSYCRQLVTTNNATLKRVLLIYELIEPNNPDVYYFWSVYEKNEGNPEKSTHYLNRAKALGFSDFEKVTG